MGRPKTHNEEILSMKEKQQTYGKDLNNYRKKVLDSNNVDADKFLDEIKDEEPKVAQGFDRGLDFDDIKTRLINHFEKLKIEYNELDEGEQYFKRRQKTKIQKIMYLSIAIIQLRNGARICEAVEAFKHFINKKKFNEPVTVKIAKSGCRRFMRSTKQYKMTQNRYRKIYFPSEWIKIEEFLDYFEFFSKMIPNKFLQKRVLDYLLYHFQCNTHSLRYCFINHLLYKEKVPLELVSKIVGHKTQTQIVAYIQNKNCNDVLANIFKK
jgi:integrase